VNARDPSRPSSPFAASSETRQPHAPFAARPRQFSLAGLLLVLTVVAAATAPLAYLARGLRGDRPSLVVFIMLSLAAPTLLLTVVSLCAYVLARLRVPRR
jgi:hypothetical protein